MPGIIYFTGNALDWMGVLLTASCGFTIARQAGLFNIGIEGQMYAGGFCASAVMLGLYGQIPPFLVLCAGVAAACAAGALMGALCGICKRFFQAHELITSFLLAAFIVPLLNYLIGGPLRGTDGNLLAMRRLPKELISPRILPPSSLNVLILAALVLPSLFWLALYRNRHGYRMRIAGAAPAFARYAGIQPERFWIGSMATSGICAALAGFMAVAGTDGICHQGFPSGTGWAAIAAGLIARNEPLLLYPACLFYTILKFTAGIAFLDSGLGSSIFTVLTGTILFFSTITKR
ncbi:MAG: ABC transporter permease [Spirochaetaceae bacterium]|jgi:simple sugar transport system permease protein|nr:ABC transporter permease [Spirochaetaceae bacterium]